MERQHVQLCRVRGGAQLANQASLLPRPRPRIQWPRLNPGLLAPGTSGSSTAPCHPHAWPRSAWSCPSPSSRTPRRLLTWSLPGRGGPTDLASEQDRRLELQEARPSSQSGHCPWVTHRPGPLSGRPPLTFGIGKWVPGLQADRTASVCPGQGLPTPTGPASAGSMARSHGRGVWPLSSVACGPRRHGLPARFRTALGLSAGKQSRGRGQAVPAPARPAPPLGTPEAGGQVQET